jgi:PST family polysaccharide transporter
MLSNEDRVEQRTRQGISWNLAGAITTNGLRVVVIAVLGRALDSHDFGIVAAAISVNVILYSIRDIGVGQAIIQRKTLEAEHLSTAFAVSTYLGLALSALLFATAPLIGKVYGITESVDVLRVLGLLFALRGVSAISRMMCQREMNFRAIAIIDALAFAIGSIVSMVLAVAGAGPWALVGGYLIEETLSTAMYLYAAPPRVSLRIDGVRFRELMTFGTGQTVAQVAGILATYGDNFVVGRSLGAEALGYYTRAYDLIKLPSTVFSNIVGNVLFPALSRVQDDPERLATSFRRVLFVNAIVLLPASAALFVLAPETIRILMGPGWDDAVLPFQILTLTMLLRTTQKLGAIVATAAGAVNAVALAYIVYMVFVIGGALVSIRWGIVGVATTTAVAIAVVSAECCYLAMAASKLTLGRLLAAHLPGALVALVVAATAWPLAAALRGANQSTAVVFGGTLVASIGLSLLLVAFWLRRSRGDFRWLRDELQRLARRASKSS